MPKSIFGIDSTYLTSPLVVTPLLRATHQRGISLPLSSSSNAPRPVQDFDLTPIYAHYLVAAGAQTTAPVISSSSDIPGEGETASSAARPGEKALSIETIKTSPIFNDIQGSITSIESGLTNQLSPATRMLLTEYILLFSQLEGFFQPRIETLMTSNAEPSAVEMHELNTLLKNIHQLIEFCQTLCRHDLYTSQEIQKSFSLTKLFIPCLQEIVQKKQGLIFDLNSRLQQIRASQDYHKDSHLAAAARSIEDLRTIINSIETCINQLSQINAEKRKEAHVVKEVHTTLMTLSHRIDSSHLSETLSYQLTLSEASSGFIIDFSNKLLDLRTFDNVILQIPEGDFYQEDIKRLVYLLLNTSALQIDSVFSKTQYALLLLIASLAQSGSKTASLLLSEELAIELISLLYANKMTEHFTALYGLMHILNCESVTFYQSLIYDVCKFKITPILSLSTVDDADEIKVKTVRILNDKANKIPQPYADTLYARAFRHYSNIISHQLIPTFPIDESALVTLATKTKPSSLSYTMMQFVRDLLARRDKPSTFIGLAQDINLTLNPYLPAMTESSSNSDMQSSSKTFTDTHPSFHLRVWFFDLLEQLNNYINSDEFDKNHINPVLAKFLSAAIHGLLLLANHPVSSTLPEEEHPFEYALLLLITYRTMYSSDFNLYVFIDTNMFNLLQQCFVKNIAHPINQKEQYQIVRLMFLLCYYNKSEQNSLSYNSDKDKHDYLYEQLNIHLRQVTRVSASSETHESHLALPMRDYLIINDINYNFIQLKNEEAFNATTANGSQQIFIWRTNEILFQLKYKIQGIDGNTYQGTITEAQLNLDSFLAIEVSESWLKQNEARLLAAIAKQHPDAGIITTHDRQQRFDELTQQALLPFLAKRLFDITHGNRTQHNTMDQVLYHAMTRSLSWLNPSFATSQQRRNSDVDFTVNTELFSQYTDPSLTSYSSSLQDYLSQYDDTKPRVAMSTSSSEATDLPETLLKSWFARWLAYFNSQETITNDIFAFMVLASSQLFQLAKFRSHMLNDDDINHPLTYAFMLCILIKEKNPDFIIDAELASTIQAAILANKDKLIVTRPYFIELRFAFALIFSQAVGEVEYQQLIQNEALSRDVSQLMQLFTIIYRDNRGILPEGAFPTLNSQLLHLLFQRASRTISPAKSNAPEARVQENKIFLMVHGYQFEVLNATDFNKHTPLLGKIYITQSQGQLFYKLLCDDGEIHQRELPFALPTPRRAIASSSTPSPSTVDVIQGLRSQLEQHKPDILAAIYYQMTVGARPALLLPKAPNEILVLVKHKLIHQFHTRLAQKGAALVTVDKLTPELGDIGQSFNQILKDVLSATHKNLNTDYLRVIESLEDLLAMAEKPKVEPSPASSSTPGMPTQVSRGRGTTPSPLGRSQASQFGSSHRGGGAGETPGRGRATDTSKPTKTDDGCRIS